MAEVQRWQLKFSIAILGQFGNKINVIILMDYNRKIK